MSNFIRFSLFTWRRTHRSNNVLISLTKLCKKKCKTLKELEKGTPHKDIARIFEVPMDTLSTWKYYKEKIYENYKRGFRTARVKPEKYEAVNKAVMIWLLIMRRENIPINGPHVQRESPRICWTTWLRRFPCFRRMARKTEKEVHLFTFEHIAY